MILQRSGLRQIPHSIVFALVNGAYCFPVVLAYVFDYREGGVENVLDIDGEQVVRFAAVYLGAVLSFHLGAWLVWRFPLYAATRAERPRDYAGQVNQRAIKILICAVCIALVATKILLIPQGVYKGYVFDNETEVGAVWTASMFFSESLIPLLFALLIANRSVANRWFLIAFVCLCLNLLHGTRIFVTATTLGVVIYFWITRPITRRFVLNGLACMAIVMAALYLTFVSRASYQYSDEASAITIALSPVVYETVFSQMSLFGYLARYQISLVGQPVGFLIDAISFTLPRFLNPDKDVGGILDAYAYLNPLGAFSGHAAGLIYLGYFMFPVYGALGAFGSWLQRRARRRPAFFILYLYFTGDILFRLMRDGYILPFKYFVDGAVIVAIAAWVMPSFKGIDRSRTVRGRTACGLS